MIVTTIAAPFVLKANRAFSTEQIWHHFKDLRAVSLNNPFGYGVSDNLGGYRLPDPYISGWEAWSEAMPDSLIESVKRAGFNAIRLAIAPGPVLWAMERGNMPALEFFAAKIFGAVDAIVATGWKCIVDFHLDADASGLPYSNKDIIDGPDGPQWTNLLACERLLAIQIAARYNPKDVAFELFNETTGLQLVSDASWKKMLSSLHKNARSVMPRHVLILSGSHSASIDGAFEENEAGGLTAIDPQEFDHNTIFTFHYYERAGFTHQGVPIGNGLAYLNRVECPPIQLKKLDNLQLAYDRVDQDRLNYFKSRSLKGDIAAYLSRYYDQSSGPGNRYNASTWSSTWVEGRFAKVADWAARNGVHPGRILLGEFGVNGDYTDGTIIRLGADTTSRAQYFATIARTAEHFGFSWCAWELENPNTGWKITDDKRALIPELTEALFPTR
jgi:hypothetical protein